MKIVVLAGGTSTERDVSLVTGSMIYKALVKNGHQAILIDLYLGYDEPDYKDIFSIQRDWAAEVNAISNQNPDISQIKAMRKDNPECQVGPHARGTTFLHNLSYTLETLTQLTIKLKG